MRLNYSLLKEVCNELNDKIINNHFSHVTVINSSDIFMQFSFYTKEKLFISLNHTNPVISLIPKEFNTPTVMGGLSENLRKYIKGTYITKIELVNEDRIIMFTLQKTDEFYEKSILHLIIELIPTRTNLIITDDSDIILFAHHYADITHTRPIVKGLKYEPIEKHNSAQNEPADLEMYKESVLMLLSEAKSKRQKETQKPLYDYLNTVGQNLNPQIQNLAEQVISGYAAKYGGLASAILPQIPSGNTFVSSEYNWVCIPDAENSVPVSFDLTQFGIGTYTPDNKSMNLGPDASVVGTTPPNELYIYFPPKYGLGVMLGGFFHIEA